MISKKINKTALSSVAIELDNLFLKHSSASNDVAAAYRRCKSLIDKARSGKIDKPGIEKLDATYFSSEFDLIEFKDLYEKSAELDMYLDGWSSEEEYNRYIKNLLGDT